MAHQHDRERLAKQDILNNVQRTIVTAQRCFDSNDVDCNRVKLDLQQALRSIHTLKEHMEEGNFTAIDVTLSQLLDQINLKLQNQVETQQLRFRAPRDVAAGRGRPKVNLEDGQLKMFQELNYTVKQMAEHFGCCEKVVNRRLHELNLPQRSKYCTMSDAELDTVVDKTQKEFTNSGSVMMGGILQAKGVFVQRSRLRKSIERVSPVSVAHRLGRTVSRRQYSVQMSNSLWHIDGHMKLIRWGISTHGGIDGHSRLIVFLDADSDNKAVTVLKHFVEACQRYSVPSRVRSDFGGENIMVSLFMNMINGEDRHSHITGRSVHNQRIERLWRDVYTQVIERYYNLFYKMEDEGQLDPENGFHVLAIEYAFLPAINSQLEEFRMGWNSHKLSTENNLSPHQMWLNGILTNVNSSTVPVRNMYGNTLAESIEERLIGYGLDPSDFRESDEQPPAEAENVLSPEEEEQILSFIADQPTPALKYKKCLEYFERFQNSDSDN